MLGVAFFLFLLTPTYILAQGGAEGEGDSILNTLKEYWLFRLFLNLLGYATLIVPGYLIIQYVKKRNWLEKAGLSNIFLYTLERNL